MIYGASIALNLARLNSEVQELMLDEKSHHALRRVMAVQELMDVDRRVGSVVSDTGQRASRYEANSHGVSDVREQTAANVIEQRMDRERHELQVRLRPRTAQPFSGFHIVKDRHADPAQRGGGVLS